MTTRTPDVVSGITTDWIPLTTPGPGPIAECSTAIYLLPGAVSGFVAFDPYYGKWIDTAVQCLATQQSQWWNQHSDGSINDINLGPFACPSGFTTASVSTINAQTSFVGCCPSDYTFLGSFLGAATLGQCHSSVDVGSTITGKSTDSSSGAWENTVAVIISTGVNVVAAHVNGYVFQDGSTTAPASVSASPTGSTTTASKGPTSSPEATSHPTSGLSSGAKIGTGVGVALGVVAVCCLVIAWIFWKRRSRSPAYPIGAVEAPSEPKRGPEAQHMIHEAPGEIVNNQRRGETSPVEMWAPHAQDR